MTSALHTKINSHTLNRGIEFDYAYSLTPPRTGTNSLGSAWGQNSLGGTVWEPTVGPAGGSGSWAFPLNVAANATGYVNQNNQANTTEAAGMSDGDWSVGLWFRLSRLHTGTSTTGIIINSANTPSTTGYDIAIAGSGATGGNASRISIQAGFATRAFGPVVTPNEWHYVAIVKAGTSVSFYYDGAFVSTTTATGAAGSVTGMRHGAITYASQTVTGTLNYSNYYLTSTAQIGATQVAEIWAVGSTSPNNLKYWNGTVWTVPTNKYQWDGINWTTLNGKYWNGSAWTNIT